MADTVALKESFSVALNSVTNMEELEKIRVKEQN